MQRAFNSYPSSIYPAFVNLVDNSVYWLQRNRKEREIRLDADAVQLRPQTQPELFESNTRLIPKTSWKQQCIWG